MKNVPEPVRLAQPMVQEVELAGTVIGLGQQYGIATPVNQQRFVALKQLEVAAGNR